MNYLIKLGYTGSWSKVKVLVRVNKFVTTIIANNVSEVVVSVEDPKRGMY